MEEFGIVIWVCLIFIVGFFLGYVYYVVKDSNDVIEKHQKAIERDKLKSELVSEVLNLLELRERGKQE